MLAEIERVVAAVTNGVFFHRLQVRLEPLASAGHIAQLKLPAGEHEQERSERLRLTRCVQSLDAGIEHLERGVCHPGICTVEGRQGCMARQLGGRTRRVGLLPRGDGLNRRDALFVVFAGKGKLSDQDLGRQLG